MYLDDLSGGEKGYIHSSRRINFPRGKVVGHSQLCGVYVAVSISVSTISLSEYPSFPATLGQTMSGFEVQRSTSRGCRKQSHIHHTIIGRYIR